MEKVKDNSGEKGFAMIPNEALNKDVGIYAYGVFCALMRYTDVDGQCFPALKTIAQLLNISERQVMRAIQKLKDLNMIRVEKRPRTKSGTWKNNTYIILNKKLWKINQVTTSQVDTTGLPVTSPGDYQSGDQVTTSHTNNTHIEQYPYTTKPIVKDLQPAAASINQVIDIFSKISQTNLFKNTAQRKAVVELLAKHPVDDVIRVARLALQVQGRPYAPVITTPYQLLHKWAQLAFYVKSERYKETSKKILVGKAGGR